MRSDLKSGLKVITVLWIILWPGALWVVLAWWLGRKLTDIKADTASTPAGPPKPVKLDKVEVKVDKAETPVPDIKADTSVVGLNLLDKQGGFRYSAISRQGEARRGRARLGEARQG